MVDLQDGKCRTCRGQLEIVGADDATLSVECTECGDEYIVETDAFHDGGIKYWPEAMVELVCHAAQVKVNDARKRRQRKRGA